MIQAITRELFTRQPRETLYHYTSLSGLIGIVGSQELRASDIRYMNDSTELRHTLELLNKQVTRRILSGVDSPGLLNAFLDWLSRRISRGPMLFGASFRANGNLLSQWRGYSVHGKGVSIGFDPVTISQQARKQGFSVGRCIYDTDAQSSLIEQVIDAVDELSERWDDDAGKHIRQADAVFGNIEEDLLRLAAVLKHPAFEEEQEWRIVSPVVRDVSLDSIQFREGVSMLVPYFAFLLNDAEQEGIALNHIYIGPSANAELSMNSVRLYMEQKNSQPRDGISYCQIPFRKR